MTKISSHKKLKRDMGLGTAIMTGLGSILGTGIFVSIGIAAGITGPSAILAIVIAAFVATCNALSSAQLAAAHSVSGGTYETGRRYLNPTLGFTAGWMFLCAKTASAATAALGFAGYFIHLFHLNPTLMVPIAVSIALILTFLIWTGLKQASWANIIIVSVTLVALITFTIIGLPKLFKGNFHHLSPIFLNSQHKLANFLYATAILFVAYTGFGRIATLSEEVKNPRVLIPKAILLTLFITSILYIFVGLVAIGIAGSTQLAQVTKDLATPLEIAANTISPHLSILIAVGACTAMLGVLLNLILGLSRVALAMGRKGDLPSIFSHISKKHVPSIAVIGVGVVIITLVLTANIEATWSFSAFSVLIYYSITNLAALRLPEKDRLYPKVFAILGLITCLFLAFWVPLKIWLTGLSLIFIGLVWHIFRRNYLKK